MKKLLLSLLTLGMMGLLASAVAQDLPPGDNPPPTPPAEVDVAAPMPPEDGSTNGPAAAEPDGVMETKPAAEPLVILPGQSKPGGESDLQTDFIPPTRASGTNNPNELRMNFRNAPLEMVLHYLSDAAGFIIVMDTRVNGNVSVISSQPMTKDEAVDLLNSVLNKNGYAAIRNGRTLTIVDKNDAKTRDIPVKSGNNPDQIPKNAEIVTQIIPIRFVEARQLVSDLTSFVSPQATVVANEAGNSIVITDTQANIRHLIEIIKAIDSSAEAETEIRVFRLKFASPTDVATELASVFPSSSSGGTQSPTRFAGGGPGGFFQRMMGGGGGGNSANNSSNDRVKKATQVTAVADARIQAVIVTAPKDLMEQIAGMMTSLDVPSDRDQDVAVFRLNNADPQQAVQVLQSMFQSTTTSRSGGSSSSQNSALMQRKQNNNTTTGSANSGSTGYGAGATGGRAGGGAQF